METLGKIYVINLAHRTDRLSNCMGWLDRTGVPHEKICRIDAIHTPGRGHIGCIASHIRTLERFLQSSEKMCLVLEDDFVPSDPTTFWTHISKLFQSNLVFDVVSCSYNQETVEESPPDAPFLRRLRNTFTSSSYIISREYAPKLHTCFLEAFYLAQIEEIVTKQKTHKYTLDVYWNTLMKTDSWYCFYPRIGYQDESYSDIQGHVTNYRV